MKRSKLINSSLFILFFLSLLNCSTKLSIVIPKGKIVNNMSITFNNNNKTILPNTFFELSDFGITANSVSKKEYFTIPLLGTNVTNNLTNIDGCLSLMKRNLVTNYDITVKNLNTRKTFYGKIAFFNAHKSFGYTASNKYYELSISEDFFEKSTRGRTSISYEYNSNHNGNGKYPTWIILISDEPL